MKTLDISFRCAAFLGCLLSGILTLRSQSAETENIQLWEKGKAPDGNGGFTDEEVFISVHRPAESNGAVMVICPGGGYGTLVMGPEGTGIAEWLNGHGITGVVLKYRLPEGRSNVPLLDAQHAIRLVRSKAKEWGCDPGKIGIIGFSAGGHLASTAATHFDKGEGKTTDAVARESSRPDFAVLVYPVITMGEITHGGSRNKLLGTDPSPEMIRFFSNELQVTEETPPTFLAHAKNDSVVPVAHSEMFYEALKEHKVPAELLVLASGNHGLDGYKGPMWEAWQSASLRWLVERGFIPKQ